MKQKNEVISSDLRYLVGSQLRIFPGYAVLYIPDIPYAKHTPGYEKPLPISTLIFQDTPYETNEERSIRRTRKKIKEIIDCNNFDLFVTFTFNGKNVDRFNVDACKKIIRTWLKNQRKKHGRFQYLIVMEYHKNGAVHFHALFGGYKGDLTHAKHHLSGELMYDAGRPVYNLAEYRSGFSTVKPIDTKLDSKSKVAFYIQKYITKDTPLIFNKNRYWVSKGLKTPIIIDNPDYRLLLLDPDKAIRVNHGLVHYFEIDKVKKYIS